MRERLIELLEEAQEKAKGTAGSMNGGFGAWYADYLLGNGVVAQPYKQTNYERIKNMSVEEMAAFIESIQEEGSYGEIKRIEGYPVFVYQLVGWLNAEVEE